jgi:hypothetical protein
MNHVKKFFLMIYKEIVGYNLLFIFITVVLIGFGFLLPSKMMAKALVGVSALNYQEVVTGVLLFKLGLGILGLTVFSICVLNSFVLKNKMKSTVALLDLKDDVVEQQRFSYWLPLLIILAVAIVLRLPGLNSGLWYDEVATLVEFVRLPVNQLLANYGDQNNHPLFSLLANISIQLFGESAWTLRLPAFLFGIASIWALFSLAQLVTDKREALFTTILMTVSYHHVWFSQNARGYTGILFWGLLSTGLFLKGCKNNRPFIWIIYAVSIALGMYTHLTVVFTFISHFLIYVFLVLKQRITDHRFSAPVLWPVISFVLVGLFTFLLYALILPQVINSFQVQVGTERVEKWTNPLWAILEVIRGLEIGFGTFMAGGIALLIFISGLVSYFKTNRIVIALFVIPLIIGTGILITLHRHFYPRFFFFELGVGLLILIRGCTVITNFLSGKLKNIISLPNLSSITQTVVISMIIIVSTLSLYHNYRYPKQDYFGALNYVEKNRSNNDIVITTGHASYPYKKYYAPHLKSVETVDEMKEIISQDRSVWLIYSFPDHMEAFYPGMLSVIQEGFTHMQEFRGTLGGGTLFVCKSKMYLPYKN